MLMMSFPLTGEGEYSEEYQRARLYQDWIWQQSVKYFLTTDAPCTSVIVPWSVSVEKLKKWNVSSIFFVARLGVKCIVFFNICDNTLCQ